MRIPVSRRHFIAGTGAALVGALTARKGSAYDTIEQHVTVDLNAEIARINPELHGHFAEHLGSCTYGGLWVGRDSRIANIEGYRKQAVDWLKALGIPVLRWPGGCFADDYHWRDGVGPQDKRPRTVNLHWGNYTEDNSFGTHEFIGLCRLLGAEPYLAGNVGSGTPRELRDWTEYCNYPAGSSLSEERIRNGAAEPFRVRYWGVGNENWGCGGNMKPEEYAGHYRRFATYLRPMGETKPFLIACGPNSNNIDWSRNFLDGMQGKQMPSGYSMHFYSSGKNTPEKFTIENMEEQLASFARMEKAVQQQRALLDSYDPDRKVGLMVDEWGVWDRMIPEEEKTHGRLWQQSTMRSAVAAAMGLNVFHRQADKLYMCNIAQIVNVLQSLLLTNDERCIRTSTYYAFELLKPHRAKTALRVDVGAMEAPGLSVSASRQDGDLVLTLVNPKHGSAMKVSCSLAGGTVKAAAARILHDSDFNAANTFETPDRLVIREHQVTSAGGSTLQISLPPMAVATVRIALG